MVNSTVELPTVSRLYGFPPLDQGMRSLTLTIYVSTYSKHKTDGDGLVDSNQVKSQHQEILFDIGHLRVCLFSCFIFKGLSKAYFWLLCNSRFFGRRTNENATSSEKR